MKDQNTPPKWPMRFLRWFCTEERLEEIEGDLHEIWSERKEEMNLRKANQLYWWLVFRSLRRFALKRDKIRQFPVWRIFLGHHLKVTWRNLLKYRMTTAINIIGLAIGISAFVAIANVIQNERSFNLHVPDKDQIYRIYTSFSGSFEATNRGVPTALVPFLRETEPEASNITSFYTRTLNADPVSDRNGETFEKIRGAYVDTSFFQFFSQYDWLAGNPKTALREPFQVVLTSEQAFKYFGQLPVEVLGKRITYEDSLEVRVVGVVKQKPGNTDFLFTDFISQMTIESSWMHSQFPSRSNWQGTNSLSQAWVKLSGQPEDLKNPSFLKGASVESVGYDDTYYREYRLQPLSQLHYDVDLGIFDGRGRAPANRQSLLILIIISFAVLLLAIFNFINLESAQVISKSKEAGIRKVIGGSRSLLLQRFLTESMVVTTLAVLLSLPLSHLGLLYFESFLPNPIPLGIENPYFWAVIVGILLVVGLVSGWYPAMMLASVKTSNALKSTAKRINGNPFIAIFRKLFISFQFGFSQLLIICTLVAFLQLDFIKEKDLGFVEDNIMLIDTPWLLDPQQRDVFINYLKQVANIGPVELQSSPPAAVRGYSTTDLKYVTDSGEMEIEVARKRGTLGYLNFYGIPLIAGQLRDAEDRKDQIVVNRTFVRKVGLKEPEDVLGMRLKHEWRDRVKNFTVVGVMEDFHSRSLRTEIMPTMFIPLLGKESCISIKVAPEEVTQRVADITKIWDEVYPDEPAEFSFLNEEIMQKYEAEQQISKLSAFTTMIAILISALGLFGLVSLSIAQRTKEVGIRKVLGATGYQIGYLITSEYLILTIGALLIAVPGAYYAIEYWMESFAYKIDISWWIYLLGGALSLFSAAMAVGGKVYFTTKNNPVEALRYE